MSPLHKINFLSTSDCYAAGAVTRGCRLITSTQIGVFLNAVISGCFSIFYSLANNYKKNVELKMLRGVHMLWAEMVSKPENLIQFILAEEELSICVNICHSMAPCFH